MRSDDIFMVRLLKRPHKFFVYWIGRPDEHIMDWTGCNFHYVKAEGQPKRGFENPWDAWLWADKRITLQTQEVYDEIYEKSGTFLSEETRDSDINHHTDGTRSFSVYCPLDQCNEHRGGTMQPPDEWWREYDAWEETKKQTRLREDARSMRQAGHKIRYIAMVLGQTETQVSEWTKDLVVAK